ncbi:MULTISPECIES: hypothetical protein [unclassified Actinomadura]|uniref:hypothetical protein n=1 Tax=unclassified Actinomadura TaxID=2626254 RepID=UPI001356C848|nr:hypothetical protein [Actinomadura sp. K4S16]
MSKHSALAAMAWAAAAVIAIISGMAAISAVGSGITDRGTEPMSPREVEAALAAPTAGPAPSPSSPAAPRPSRRPAPTVTVTQKITTSVTNLASEAGDIVARCNHGSAYLASWTPRQGYSVGDSRRGPQSPVFVRFRSSARQVTMVVACRGDRPFATVRRERTDRTGEHPDDRTHTEDPYHRHSESRE